MSLVSKKGTLSRMQTFEGEVMYGSQRAALLGYPTVNIEMGSPDIDGIYAAKVTIDGVGRIAAAFADPKRGVLEAHLLDTTEDFYGKLVQIELVKKIRDTVTFSNEEALKDAIDADVAKVREYFKNH